MNYNNLNYKNNKNNKIISLHQRISAIIKNVFFFFFAFQTFFVNLRCLIPLSLPVSQEAAHKHTLMSLVQRRPVIGPDCSKCPAPLTHSDDVMTHPLIGCCLFRPEGGASVSPVQEEAEPEESSANQSQGKRSRKHKKRKSDGERSY